jgi:hypothetical protein
MKRKWTQRKRFMIPVCILLIIGNILFITGYDFILCQKMVKVFYPEHQIITMDQLKEEMKNDADRKKSD